MSNHYQELLKELKLSGMEESIEYRIEEATESNLDFNEFICLLLEDEKLYRKNRRSASLRKKARFNNNAALEEFNVYLERGITRSMIKKLATLNFMREGENIIFIGGTGTGKSYLAQALGHKSCAHGSEALYLPVNVLFKRIQEAEVNGSYLRLLERMKKAKLIILDDFGLRNYSHKEALALYDLLEDSYRKRSMVITSQIKPKGWQNLFEDAVIAEAIIDRITSCAHTIEITGPSYRKKHSPKERIDYRK